MTSPKRGSNLHKRGNTWTYYLYVTEGDGSRRQISKGGFATRRDAEAARAEALAAINPGTFVRPDRLSLRDFLVDEWLPSQRPPTLEESTYRSYARYIDLHVVAYIGALPLQKVTPMDLNALYRTLLDSAGAQPRPRLGATTPQPSTRSPSTRPTGSPGPKWPT